MSNEEQIAAIKNAVATLDSSIKETQEALKNASSSDEIRSLTSTLTDLRAQRALLQAQLENLQAAAVEVAPLKPPEP